MPKHYTIVFFLYLTLVNATKTTLLDNDKKNESTVFQAIIAFDISDRNQTYTSREYE